MHLPIAIVEDDDEIRESMMDALSTEGYLVKGFRNGQEAIDELENKFVPCLILLDLMMPIMDGWQFLKHKTSLTSPMVDVPVIIVSAVADANNVKQSGALGYIRKPLDLNVLLKLVETHCPPPQMP